MEFEGIARLLESRTGLVFPPARAEAVDRAVARMMDRARARDAAELVERLLAEAPLLDDLVAELTVQETYFFREPAQFEVIRREVLPEVRRLRGTEHLLRAWSAGCATGEEAYSLAILFEEEGVPAGARVLATDISRRALARAAEAVYGDWSLRGAREEFVRRYFRGDGGRHALETRIRDRVALQYLNLASDVFPSLATGTWGMDLILCRNVLIYFGRATIAAVARRLYDSLAQGGFLITGPSDPSLAEYAPFDVSVGPAGMVYRRGARAAQVPAAPAPTPILHHEDTNDFEGQDEAFVDLPALRAFVGEDRSEQPPSIEEHFRQAVLLLAGGRCTEAEAAARRAVYLDRSAAVGWFVLGSILCARQDLAGAWKAYRNSAQALSQRPADEEVPFSEGERAGRLAEAARAQMSLLESRGALR